MYTQIRICTFFALCNSLQQTKSLFSFDPSRHLPKDINELPPFVGWGAGRHPCIGMRFAKLEIKWIMLMLVTAFDFEVVNERDEVLEKLPEPSHTNV